MTAITEYDTCDTLVTSFDADNFNKAYEGLRKMVMTQRIYSWARVCVEDSIESAAALRRLYTR